MSLVDRKVVPTESVRRLYTVPQVVELSYCKGVK